MEFLKVEKYTYLQEKHKEYLEELKEFVKTSRWRPKYHVTPPCGLMNDPNGLCYFQGEYHMFYQWFPFGASHGMKHWAHVKSKNMVDWEWSEEMLIPDQEYEKHGCYSGNAIIKDQEAYLFYTANYKIPDGRIPKQALAIMNADGQIQKYDKNPIVDGAPEGMTGDIRDPFVFEKNGRYYMLIAGRDLNDIGQIVVYESADLFDWSYKGILSLGVENLGTMLECPAYVQVDGRDVLLISSIGIEKKNDRFHNQFTSLYFIGELDIENLNFSVDVWDEIDCGFDFYAPQTFYDKENNPVMIGWFGCGEQKLPTDQDMWRHGMTIPRTLKIVDGKLGYEMIKEAKDQFGSPLFMNDKKADVDDTTYAVLICWNKEEGNQSICIGEEGDYIKLSVDWNSSTFSFDRSNLAVHVDPGYGLVRTCSFAQGEQLAVEVFVDNSFIEIYLNNGERVLSGRAFFESNEVFC